MDKEISRGWEEQMKIDYKFFLDNLADLYATYGERVVVIKECNVLGAYDSEDAAIKETAKAHRLGTFIVQRCAKDHAALVAHFAGNVM